MPAVPAISPGIDDSPSLSLSWWTGLSLTPLMRVRGGGPHDGPSDFSQLHTHLFCVAFVRHLSRTISDIRRAYRHWLGCHTFVNFMRDGGGSDASRRGCSTPLVCNALKCPLDRYQTSALFASSSAERKSLNRGILEGCLRRVLTSYRSRISLFTPDRLGDACMRRRAMCLLLLTHRHDEPIRFHR